MAESRFPAMQEKTNRRDDTVCSHFGIRFHDFLTFQPRARKDSPQQNEKRRRSFGNKENGKKLFVNNGCYQMSWARRPRRSTATGPRIGPPSFPLKHSENTPSSYRQMPPYTSKSSRTRSSRIFTRICNPTKGRAAKIFPLESIIARVAPCAQYEKGVHRPRSRETIRAIGSGVPHFAAERGIGSLASRQRFSY